MADPHRKRVVLVLRIVMVIVLLLIIALAGLIFMLLMNHNNKKNAEEDSTITDADFSKVEDGDEIADISGMNIVPNGDAAISHDSWMAGKKVYKPERTDSTISLPAADLSVFQQAIEDSEGADGSKPEDGESKGPWEDVTLSLSSVEGSLNYSAPGDPVKTQQMTSTYMILVDLDEEAIVAERECDKVVSPASMTKIMTVLTAREFIDESKLDDTFVITTEITDYVDDNDCSAVGFLPGDEVTVRDLLYGTILPSGADAAMGLAEYCCGDQQTFVDMMNEKVDELGLSETAHFTNVVGVYNEDLHCTMKDMAIILGMAVQDDLLKDVLSKRTYVTQITYEELDLPDGIELSNWFLRRIEDKPMPGNCVAAKTGFVDEAGCCAASYFEANNGKKYICVTGNAFSSWRAIYDHVSVYRSFIPE